MAFTPLQALVTEIEHCRARIRDDIESIRHTVSASRRTMGAARMAMKRADDALARPFGLTVSNRRVAP
jgi:hypothetical protein